MLSQKDNTLKEVLRKKDVALYEYAESVLPDPLLQKEKGLVSMYVRQKDGSRLSGFHSSERTYERLSELQRVVADVCLLDGVAIKLLLARLPMYPSYILVRLKPHRSWTLGFLGLIRRLLLGHVKIVGIQAMKAESGTQWWVVLKRTKKLFKDPLSLSEEIGTLGLVKHLKEENVSYVVLRFFEKLPELYNEAADLDLLGLQLLDFSL